MKAGVPRLGSEADGAVMPLDNPVDGVQSQSGALALRLGVLEIRVALCRRKNQREKHGDADGATQDRGGLPVGRRPKGDAKALPDQHAAYEEGEYFIRVFGAELTEDNGDGTVTGLGGNAVNPRYAMEIFLT